MHSVTHSLTHRAQPATRRSVRWQPYNAIATPRSDKHVSPPPLVTPLNSAFSSTPSSSSSTPLCETDRPKQALPTSKEPIARDPIKVKHATSLVDQAAKSLCDIWHPYDIPIAFLSSSRAAVTIGGAPDALLALPRPTFTGSTIRSPPTQSPSARALPVAQTISLGSHELASSQAARSNLCSLKTFVHEVIRRSRASGIVLQTALCYLEALRSKVPELVRLEKEGKGVRGDPDLSSRITPLERSFAPDATTLVGTDPSTCISEDLIATVKVIDDYPLVQTPSPSKMMDNDITPTNEKPLCSSDSSCLPSPLLCPRRAFLASLILASKFTQDRCYSNRAWAKLCGLPPREIGRCERALGDALEWRLWVGKKQPGRTFGRSHSEGSLSSPTPDAGVWAASAPSLPVQDAGAAQVVRLTQQKPASPKSRKLTASGLRRSTTAPDLNPPSPPPMFVNPIAQPLQQPIASTSAVAEFQKLFHEPEAISPVPSLSHSPSSTDSSGGDQTIQMSVFFDENTISNASGPAVKPPFDMDAWSWSGQAATSLPSAHLPHCTSIPDSSHHLFLSKAMMDDAAVLTGIIPEPMVGILQDGYEGTTGAFCGQEEAFVAYGAGAGISWDRSLVY